MNSNKNQWITEFKQFMDTQGVDPPSNLNAQVNQKVFDLLHPSWLRVFVKLTGVHTLSGSLSLFLCPQFGVNPTGGMGLMHYFMGYGDFVCMLACASVFVGTSAALAVIFLKPEDLFVIKNNKLISFFTLGLLSIGVFLCLGSDVFSWLSLYWLLGSGLMGSLIFDLSRRLKERTNAL